MPDSQRNPLSKNILGTIVSKVFFGGPLYQKIFFGNHCIKRFFGDHCNIKNFLGTTVSKVFFGTTVSKDFFWGPHYQKKNWGTLRTNQTSIFWTVKKTYEMGRSRKMNERNEKSRTRPTLLICMIDSSKTNFRTRR